MSTRPSTDSDEIKTCRKKNLPKTGEITRVVSAPEISIDALITIQGESDNLQPPNK